MGYRGSSCLRFTFCQQAIAVKQNLLAADIALRYYYNFWTRCHCLLLRRSMSIRSSLINWLCGQSRQMSYFSFPICLYATAFHKDSCQNAVKVTPKFAFLRHMLVLENKIGATRGATAARSRPSSVLTSTASPAAIAAIPLSLPATAHPPNQNPPWISTRSFKSKPRTACRMFRPGTNARACMGIRFASRCMCGVMLIRISAG